MNYALATAYRACSICAETIKPGDLRATHLPGGSAHAECAQAPSDKTPACPNCFLVGPCACL